MPTHPSSRSSPSASARTLPRRSTRPPKILQMFFTARSNLPLPRRKATFTGYRVAAHAQNVGSLICETRLTTWLLLMLGLLIGAKRIPRCIARALTIWGLGRKGAGRRLARVGGRRNWRAWGPIYGRFRSTGEEAVVHARRPIWRSAAISYSNCGHLHLSNSMIYSREAIALYVSSKIFRVKN